MKKVSPGVVGQLKQLQAQRDTYLNYLGEDVLTCVVGPYLDAWDFIRDGTTLSWAKKEAYSNVQGLNSAGKLVYGHDLVKRIYSYSNPFDHVDDLANYHSVDHPVPEKPFVFWHDRIHPGLITTVHRAVIRDNWLVLLVNQINPTAHHCGTSEQVYLEIWQLFLDQPIFYQRIPVGNSLIGCMLIQFDHLYLEWENQYLRTIDLREVVESEGQIVRKDLVKIPYPRSTFQHTPMAMTIDPFTGKIFSFVSPNMVIIYDGRTKTERLLDVEMRDKCEGPVRIFFSADGVLHIKEGKFYGQLKP